MSDSATALQREYAASPEELSAHIDDLLSRFANRALGGHRRARGTGPHPEAGARETGCWGAALYCAAMDIAPDHIVKGIVAALCYDNPDDEAAVLIRRDIRQHGIEAGRSEILRHRYGFPAV